MKIFKFILVFGILVSTANSAQTIKELMTPPADSADRENLRIWVPIERNSTCRMTIDILDSKGDTIRHLLDARISPGYHNFYWDKKNDSGEFVSPGEYDFRIKDCGGRDSGKLKVSYNSNEIFAELLLWLSEETTIWSDKDSIDIRVELYEFDDSLMIFELDTTLHPGIHSIDFTGLAQAEIGGFRETVWVNGEKIKERLEERCR